ncbi:MAG: hypothetical protein DWQ29_00580 [Planctomycetota bacterium]|nr:MAG: hypothetical protein DWQ29_00580 [Planctomycetota bacterium]
MSDRANPQSEQTISGSAAPWKCSESDFNALLAAVAEFWKRPADLRAERSISESIERLAETWPGGSRALNAKRTAQLSQLGRFTQRYVATRRVRADGSLSPMERPRPTRDGVPARLRKIVESDVDRYPGGWKQFLIDEQPLVRANCADFKRLVRQTVTEGLQELKSVDQRIVPLLLANLLDLLSAYRHVFLQVAEAHPTALQRIDAGEVDVMIEFVTAVGRKTPLTRQEFAQFIQLVLMNWKSSDPAATVLRGRIVHSGLDGKPDVLKKWIAPFVRELSNRSLLGRLHAVYAEKTGRSAPSPRKDFPRGNLHSPSVLEHDTGELTTSDTGLNMVVPIGAPMPEHLHVLRNYVKSSSLSAVVTLREAMRIARANPDVLGHRQYVLRTFQEDGWVMANQKGGEPVFEKRAGVSGSPSPSAR